MLRATYDANMADRLLVRSLAAKSVSLCNKKLEKVPRIIGKLTAALQIDLKNNFLADLPEEFGYLVQVGVRLTVAIDVAIIAGVYPGNTVVCSMRVSQLTRILRI